MGKLPLVAAFTLLGAVAARPNEAVSAPPSSATDAAVSAAAFHWPGHGGGHGGGSSGSACCRALSKALPSAVFAPQSSGYDQLINDRWSNTSILHPGCVVAVTSAKDVSKAMKIISKNQCKFAVRSGGHNANPGANSINDGVSIDLSGLNKTSLAQDRGSVTLESGVTWGQAYDTFANDKVGFTGGICEDVGAGGIAVGGGQSLFQPKLGWAVDNILNYEVVLASGKIVNANRRSNPDLFKALKGGNTNFGIVTKVQIKAFDFPGMWAGEVYVGLQGDAFPLPASRDDVVDKMSAAMTEFTSRNHEDTASAVQLMIVYLRHNQGQIMNAAIANTANVEKPPILKPFLDMPNKLPAPFTHTEFTNISSFVHKVSEFQTKGHRQVTASLTYNNDYETTREIWKATDEIYNSLDFKEQLDWMISFIPQPKIMQTHSAASGGNSLGLEKTKDDQMVVWITTRWDSAELDSKMEEVRARFVKTVEEVTKRRKTYNPFIYINYAAPTQDPLCGYGKENVRQLKKAAKKYDPKQVFQKLMPGGFKLANARC